jgi:hypothetical protein
MGRLRVTVVSGHNLIAKDTTGTSDPFVEAILGGQRHRTRTVPFNLNPHWGESFIFNVTNQMTETLTLIVYDYDIASRNDQLGTATVSLSHLQRGVPSPMTVQLQGVRHGHIQIDLFAEDFGMGGAPMGGGFVPQPMYTQPMQYQQPMMSPPMGYPHQGYPSQPMMAPPQMGYPPQGYPPQPMMQPQYPPQQQYPSYPTYPQPQYPPQSQYPTYPPQPQYPPY